MKNLHTRSVATSEEVRRLGPLGAFDWAVAKMRDAVAHDHREDQHGYTLELWLDDGRELTEGRETG